MGDDRAMGAPTDGPGSSRSGEEAIASCLVAVCQSENPCRRAQQRYLRVRIHILDYDCRKAALHEVREAQAQWTYPIITTEKPSACPQCGSPMVSTSANDYQCNACGFTCSVFTAQDELDAEADKIVRTRGYNEEHGRGKKISRFQDEMVKRWMSTTPKRPDGGSSKSCWNCALRTEGRASVTDA